MQSGGRRGTRRKKIKFGIFIFRFAPKENGKNGGREKSNERIPKTTFLYFCIKCVYPFAEFYIEYSFPTKKCMRKEKTAKEWIYIVYISYIHTRKWWFRLERWCVYSHLSLCSALLLLLLLCGVCAFPNLNFHIKRAQQKRRQRRTNKKNIKPSTNWKHFFRFFLSPLSLPGSSLSGEIEI